MEVGSAERKPLLADTTDCGKGVTFHELSLEGRGRTDGDSLSKKWFKRE